MASPGKSRADGFLAKQHRLLIDGEERDNLSGDRIDVVDAATGLIMSSVPAGGAEDVDSVVRAARASFDDGRWRFMSTARDERRRPVRLLRTKSVFVQLDG